MMFAMMKPLQEDDTTAYSSWNDSDDLSSEYTGKDTDTDEQLDEDNLLHPSPTEALHRTILAERAAVLMRRESSIEYGESSYIEDDAAAQLNKLSLQSGTRSCGQSSTDSSGLYNRIDLGCRSKMMEWAISVVEFSYPPPHDLSLRSSRNGRKHSVETLRIVSAAFSYVDRIMAQPQSGPKPRKRLLVQSRKEYKLLCMISLHLAAKMSGLFSSGDHEYVNNTILEPETTPSAIDGNKDRMKSKAESMVSICTATTTCSSSKSSPHSREADQNEEYSRVTPDETSFQEGPLHTFQPRPVLHLLSFKGLYGLCQGEFSIEEMCNMELSILSTLDWRLNGGLVLEWLSLLLECIAYCQSYGVTRQFDLAVIKEHALVHLEDTVKYSKPMTMKPSEMARAALASSLEVIFDAAKDDGDGDELSLMQSCLSVLDTPEICLTGTT
jgi:hypothetical protein